jgi:farnesyl-diphosphate farnesyltransferase
MPYDHTPGSLRKHADYETWIKANEESLTRQSRSFSIPILNLDDRFLIPTMVEYNLNKTIDTIEDSKILGTDEKIDLIRNFCDHLDQGKPAPGVKKRMLDVAQPEEAYVFKNYEATINLYNTLSAQETALSRKWTREMADGMCMFLRRPIDTLKDLNVYCYYVAGTVGLYLTHLLKLKGSNITPFAVKKLEGHAVSFGLFLQKLNIIRDHQEDHADKRRSFWPRSFFEQEKDPLKILNRMCEETLTNDVPGAIEYFRQIPGGNQSYDFFIRFTLSSGLAYLKILRNNRAVFSGKKVKLPKKFITSLYASVSSQPKDTFLDYCQSLL